MRVLLVKLFSPLQQVRSTTGLLNETAEQMHTTSA